MYKNLLEIQKTFDKYKNVRVAFHFASPLISTFLNADRVLILKHEMDTPSNRAFLKVFHEYDRDDVSPLYYGDRLLRKIFVDEIFSDYALSVTSTKPIVNLGDPYIRRVEEIDTVPELMKDYFSNSEIKSMIIQPILINNTVWGTIGVNDTRISRDFENDGTVEKIGIISRIIADYLSINGTSFKMSLNANDEHSLRMAALGKLAAGIAHEINNPIFIIGGFAQRIDQLLLEEMNDERNEEIGMCVEMIEKNCKKATNIVEGLRLMSRSTTNDELEVADLNDIVSKIVNVSKERFQLNKIKIESDLSSGELLVECKPGQISQVVTNLLNNSFDSLCDLATKRWIKVSTLVDGENVILSVVDAGKKLGEDIMNNMMDPFFTTKPPGKGTGLGLSICKEIIKRFNGNFEVDRDCSNVKFDITLPLISFDEDDE